MDPVPVLFLEPTLGPGGAEGVLFEIVTRLDPERFKPIVCCLKQPGVVGDALIARGIPVYHGILASRYSPAPLPVLVRLMRRERIRIVHTIDQPLNTTWGVVAGRFAGTPAQVTSVHRQFRPPLTDIPRDRFIEPSLALRSGHGNEPRLGSHPSRRAIADLWNAGIAHRALGMPRHSQRRIVNRLLRPSFDAVIALSEAHRDFIVAEGDIDPGKVRVIHNGIDLERFRSDTPVRRVDLGLPADAPLVGVVAGLRPEKAHDTFLRAAAAVRDRLPCAHFVLIGDGLERERLTRLAGALNLASCTHFLGRRDDVAGLLPLLDLSVLPSLTEAFPLAILESMAAGRPVVASDVGSVPDIVASGETGLLVPADDIDRLADAMVRLLADPGLARRMGEAGRTQVQRFDVRRMVREVEDLFDELLEAKIEAREEGAGRVVRVPIAPVARIGEPVARGLVPRSGPGEGIERATTLGRVRGGDSPRVLVVTNMYPRPDNPSLGIFVKQQVESIRSKGVDVDVLFVDGPRSKANYLRGVLDVARQTRTRRYDLIHAHYVFSGFLARTQFRCPIVLTHHGIEAILGWQKPLCRAITPLVDQVIAVSDQVKAALGDPRVRVIPCGIDTERFVPGDRDSARRILGLPDDRPLVLWAAANRPEKRLDRARQAISILQHRLPDAALVVASGRPPEQIPTYMNACDVLLLTSDAEGSPQVVKEAMACNLPVVSVNVGDVARVIGDTEGCFVTEKDPHDIAAKLEAALRRGQRTAGRAAVVDRFGLSATADRVIAVYRDTLVGAPRGA